MWIDSERLATDQVAARHQAARCQASTIARWPVHASEERPAAPGVIVAREGSELAQHLRARGWVARSGWRATAGTGHGVWYVRFEPRGETAVARAGGQLEDGIASRY
jgi:hypothetical protein